MNRLTLTEEVAFGRGCVTAWRSERELRGRADPPKAKPPLGADQAGALSLHQPPGPRGHQRRMTGRFDHAPAHHVKMA